MKKRFLISAIVLLASTSIFTSCEPNDSGGEFVKVYVEDYGEHNVGKFISVTGIVENGNTTPYIISTNIDSYKVKTLNVQVGDYVNAGDIICEFDTSDIEKQIQEAESKLKSNSAMRDKTLADLKNQLECNKQIQKTKLDQLNALKSENQVKYDNALQKYNTASSNYNNNIILYNDAEENLKNSSLPEDITKYSSLCEFYLANINLYSQEMSLYNNELISAKDLVNTYTYEYDITKIETDMTINDIQYKIDSFKSESELEQTISELNETLEKSVIRAEYSGIVSVVNISEGQRNNTPNLVTIIDDNNKIIHAKLNDNDVLSVKEGMEVNITTASDSIGSLKGKIYKINKVRGESGFDVYIKCDTLDEVNIGISVSNNIVVYNENVNSVDKDAIRTREDNSNYVLIAIPNGTDSYTLEERDIITGVTDNEYAQITSGDLELGDKVVVGNDTSLEKDMNVSITEKE